MNSANFIERRGLNGYCTTGALWLFHQIQRTPETLDQRHRASLCCGVVIAGGFDQMTRNGAIDDAQHLVLTAMQKRLLLGLCAKRRHDRAPRGWSKRRISRAYFWR